MRFNLESYETVQSRLDIFWTNYPNGRIETILVDYSNDKYIIQALVYRDAEDANPFATGYAEETIGSSPVNKTSAIENCETSAIGRALRNGSIGKNASREEMEKVERGAEPTEPKLISKDEVIGVAIDAKDIQELRDLYKRVHESVLAEAYQWLDDGGFDVKGTVGDYLVHLSKKMVKS